MKRLALIWLILLYGVTSSGFTLQLHYCCGKLKNISLAGAAHAPCKMGGVMKAKPCCQNKLFVLSEKNDQEESAFKIPVGRPDWQEHDTVLPAVNTLGAAGRHTFVSTIVSIYSSGPPLYLQNRVLRI